MKSKSINFYLGSKWYKKWLVKTSRRKKPTVSSPTDILLQGHQHVILSCGIETSLSQQSLQMVSTVS